MLQMRDLNIPLPNEPSTLGVDINPPSYEIASKELGSPVFSKPLLSLSHRSKVSEMEKIEQLAHHLCHHLTKLASKGMRKGLLCLTDFFVAENTPLDCSDKNITNLNSSPPEWIQLSRQNTSTVNSLPYSTFSVASTIPGTSSGAHSSLPPILPDIAFLLQEGVLPKLEKSLLSKTHINQVVSYVLKECSVRTVSEFGLYESVTCSVIVIEAQLS
jgi:hypothetical protein